MDNQNQISKPVQARIVCVNLYTNGNRSEYLNVEEFMVNTATGVLSFWHNKPDGGREYIVTNARYKVVCEQIS